MNARQRGVIEVVMSGVCFGFLGIFGKYLYQRGVSPGELLTLRFSTAAVLMLGFHLLRSPSQLRLTLRQLLACALLGIGGYALFAFCYFKALTGISASLTVLLLYTYPAFVALGAWIFFGESIPRQHLWALPLAGCGLLGLVWGEWTVDRYESLAFGIGSSVFYSLYILLSSRLLRGLSPLVSTPYIQLFAGLTMASLYLRSPERAWAIVSDSWLLVAAIAIICTIMAMSLFLAGLQKLKNWEVSLLSTTEPLVGVLMATLLLGERLSWEQSAGALAILMSLVWISRPVPLPKKASH